VAIQIYSDDSGEVMGATLKSKAARRHLDRAGELLEVTGSPRRRTGRVHRQDADRRHDLGRQRQP
jgi:hypothetical protein